MAEALHRAETPPDGALDIPPLPGAECTTGAPATSALPRGLLSGAFALVPDRPRAFRYLLILRFSLVNLVAGALLAAAYLQGWIAPIFRTDTTHLSHLIGVVFLAGLALCAWRIVQTSRELNVAKEFDIFAPKPSRALAYITMVRGRGADSRMIAVQALRSRFAHRIAPVHHIANSLVVLGLIGTVIGFIIALSGVKPEVASDVGAVAPMVSRLIQGMSVALYTTLVGAVLNIWLMVDYRILASGTATLANTIIELGETHARS